MGRLIAEKDLKCLPKWVMPILCVFIWQGTAVMFRPLHRSLGSYRKKGSNLFLIMVKKITEKDSKCLLKWETLQLLAWLMAEGYTSGVYNTPDGATSPAPIFPGESFSFTVDAKAGEHLSFASMLGKSNDLFFCP